MNRTSVGNWLERYVDAWRTYEPAKIRDLFSENATYLYSPYDEDKPLRGREAIVASWLENQDAPGSWQADYAPVAVEGNVAVARGRTRYVQPDGSLQREFANLFLIEFDDDGRCSRFTEWYMQPRGS
jgi:hypothetical protein